jgi:hypothetical protein
MSTEQINASLDAMLENPKSKNFLNHMVRSYFPVGKVDKIWEKPKGDFKCALTRTPLVSVAEILEVTRSDEFKASFLESLKIKMDGTISESPFTKFLGEQKLGLTGKDTTTFLSPDGYQALYDWVIKKSFENNKHINWLLNGVRRDEFLTRAQSMGDVNVQNKAFKAQDRNEGRKVASFKMGDTNSALADLKAKMEKQGL